MAFFAVENGQIVNTGPLNGQHVSIEIAPDDESCIESVGGNLWNSLIFVVWKAL